ncbi:hypothetical protein [Rhodoferax lithotrophicus]|uniref:hypothetical protein n=1 Tax=Rhodoferax lithotrophicus TaxID=2798804 RepID=UPI001CC33319|nr:hypothetical protein [Rhodoferax sp. MIZ03]
MPPQLMPFLNHPCCCNTREVTDEQVRDAASATRVHEGTSRHAKPVLAGSAHVFPGVDVGTDEVATWTLFSDALWVDFRLKLNGTYLGPLALRWQAYFSGFEAIRRWRAKALIGWLLPSFQAIFAKASHHES